MVQPIAKMAQSESARWGRRPWRTRPTARDLASAPLFIALGIGATAIAVSYPIGTLHRIGPGALPLGVGTLLIVVGIVLAAQAGIRGAEAGPLLPTFAVPDGWAGRAVVSSRSSLVGFALLIWTMGLFVATAALALIARLAERGASLIGSVVVALVLAALCSGIFVYAIGLPFRVWPLLSHEAVQYDPVDGFEHIGMIAKPPYVMVINPGLEAETVQDVIDRARACGCARRLDAARSDERLCRAMAGLRGADRPRRMGRLRCRRRR
jgi:hypothetical protein